MPISCRRIIPNRETLMVLILWEGYSDIHDFWQRISSHFQSRQSERRPAGTLSLGHLIHMDILKKQRPKICFYIVLLAFIFTSTMWHSSGSMDNVEKDTRQPTNLRYFLHKHDVTRLVGRQTRNVIWCSQTTTGSIWRSHKKSVTLVRRTLNDDIIQLKSTINSAIPKTRRDSRLSVTKMYEYL